MHRRAIREIAAQREKRGLPVQLALAKLELPSISPRAATKNAAILAMRESGESPDAAAANRADERAQRLAEARAPRGQRRVSAAA